jgi:hypothetical protein
VGGYASRARQENVRLRRLLGASGWRLNFVRTALLVNAGGKIKRGNTTLPWLFALYAAATLLHFVHNAEHLTEYPNLPATWSRAEIYAAWCCVMALGLLGYGLYNIGHRNIGLLALGSYASLGFGGLLHYTRAPMAHHSVMMNVTIWAEAIAAAQLLANVVVLGGIASGSMPPNHRWRGP